MTENAFQQHRHNHPYICTNEAISISQTSLVHVLTLEKQSKQVNATIASNLLIFFATIICKLQSMHECTARLTAHNCQSNPAWLAWIALSFVPSRVDMHGDGLLLD